MDHPRRLEEMIYESKEFFEALRLEKEEGLKRAKPKKKGAKRKLDGR